LLPPKKKRRIFPFSAPSTMEQLESIVAKLELENDKAAAANPTTQKSLSIVHEFLKTHRVMCYGGTAINNLLPPEDRFYDPETTVPDYDFYSKNPQEDAMTLANQLSQAGVINVEVKPGIHLGTFKVFADFEGVADITHLDEAIFEHLWKEEITKGGIRYVTPNFLRLSMYLELSRPRGDVSRWTKVYERLQLLNKHYPLSCPMKEVPETKALTEAQRAAIEHILKTHNVVLLGITASQIHAAKGRPKWEAPVTLLAELPTMQKLIEGKSVEVEDGTEILPPRADILDENGNVFIRIHETASCHSYHQMANGIKVASIPTMLQFYFAYMFEGGPESELTHLMCVSQRLVDLAAHKEKRRYAILTPMECLGEQPSLVDIKRSKSELYQTLSKNKSSVEFLKYFFTYNPKDSKTKRVRLREHLRATRRARVEDAY
jgi:hypothetical protein